MKYRDRIIVALDTSDFAVCKKWVQSLKGLIRFFKIGSELFTAAGRDAVRYVQDQGSEVFLDLKFHDIPNTVARAAQAAADMGIRMLNVHALGGVAMMRAAKDAVDTRRRPWVLGVTILTSIGGKELSKELRIGLPLKKEVMHLASLCRKAGLDGVVASAREAAFLKKKFGPDFKVITPGIRPRWAVKGDQNRVVTPREAFSLGADYIVIGRPVTASSDLRKAASRILEEVENG